MTDKTRLKKIQDIAVYYLEAKDDILYLATAKGVYIFKDGQIERVFVIREKGSLFPQIIKADLFDDKKVWLGTTKGLFFSLDEGKSWHKFYANLLDNLSIWCIEQTKLEKDTLYLAGPKGFFRLDVKNKKVDQIFEGIFSSSINWIEINSAKIWLATDKGLFKSNHFSSTYYDVWDKLLEKEPSIEEVQEAALRYNEVHPEKIRRWRNALKIRALFPQISLDYDKVIYGSYKGEFAVGPRDWGISITWDVGDLIWNSYEDDIDSRSKLTTQLRLDILDEINRVYFERLRIKYQILSGSLSQKDMLEKYPPV